MTAKQKRDYLALALSCGPLWLAASTADPSPYMRPIHVTLCRIALRKLARKL